MKTIEQRNRPARRVLMIVRILQRSRVGLSRSEIRRRINILQHASWCDRTIRRDLELLLDLQLIDYYQDTNYVFKSLEMVR